MMTTIASNLGCCGCVGIGIVNALDVHLDDGMGNASDVDLDIDHDIDLVNELWIVLGTAIVIDTDINNGNGNNIGGCLT